MKAVNQKRIERAIKAANDMTDKGVGIVAQIVKLYTKGFTRKELIEAGFNKNTVHRQVREKVVLA